jgi:hypothetical protein
MAALLMAAPAFAQHPAPRAGAPANLQGTEGHAWMANTNMKRFYELSKATLGPGAPKLDFPAYLERSYAIFRDFGASMGMSPAAMVDHLKLIPGQVVQIVKEDPHVLDSYDKFIEAMIGPP